jgi:hypothetical protein
VEDRGGVAPLDALRTAYEGISAVVTAVSDGSGRGRAGTVHHRGGRRGTAGRPRRDEVVYLLKATGRLELTAAERAAGLRVLG